MLADLKLKNKWWNSWIIPIIIFLIALIVRSVGLKFGFPLFTHPDENFLVSPLRSMSLNHTLDPGTYVYPAYPSFYSKVFVMNILSQIKFGENYGWIYWQDPYFFYTVSRWMTAIQGALLPVVAWFIGQKFNQINFSWVAAILFIFYPPFVLYSHYVTVDIPLTLYVMLVLLFCLNCLSTNKNIWLILASVMVAIAAMEKYPGILAIGIVMVTIGIRAFTKGEQKPPQGWAFFFRKVASALAIIALSIVIIAPSLFINYETAWNQIVNEARPTHLGADALGWGGNLLFYLKDFFTNSGLIISIFVAVGLTVVVFLKDPAFLLLCFGCGYWIALSMLSLHWSRWSLPMMTTPLFLAAIAVTFLWQQTKNKKPARIALSIIVLIGFVPFVLQWVVTSVMLTWPDTRNEALRYMEENEITDDITVSEGYTPYNPNNKNDIFDFDISQPNEKKYIVLSSFMGDRYAAESQRYLVENTFYAAVRSQTELLKEFHPNPEPTSVVDQLGVIWEYVERHLKASKPRFLTGPSLAIYRLQD